MTLTHNRSFKLSLLYLIWAWYIAIATYFTSTAVRKNFFRKRCTWFLCNIFSYVWTQCLTLKILIYSCLIPQTICNKNSPCWKAEKKTTFELLRRICRQNPAIIQQSFPQAWIYVEGNQAEQRTKQPWKWPDVRYVITCSDVTKGARRDICLGRSILVAPNWSRNVPW